MEERFRLIFPVSHVAFEANVNRWGGEWQTRGLSRRHSPLCRAFYLQFEHMSGVYEAFVSETKRSIDMATCENQLRVIQAVKIVSFCLVNIRKALRSMLNGAIRF
jgi:hypothetical protein